jgi:nucleotide-binding universal stress UspA family protein
MHVLAPIDGSDCSFAALEFATDLAAKFDADLTAVHMTEFEDRATEKIMKRARRILSEAGVDGELVVDTHSDLSSVKASTHIGKHILEFAEEGGYDHIVMGRHGGGRLEKALLGSCSESVIKHAEVPVTFVP